MKLATKLVSVFFLVVLGLIAIDSFFEIRRDADRHEAILRRDIERVGRYIQFMVVDLGRDHDRTLAMIEALNAQEAFHGLRWVRFDPSAEMPERPRAAVALAEFQADEDGVFLLPLERQAEEARMLAYVRVESHDAPGAVEIERAAPELARLRRDGVVRGWKLASYLLVCAVAFVFFATRWMARPLGLLTEKTRQISAGDFTSPVTIDSKDELSELGDALNTMCGELAASRAREEEVNAARLEMVKQLRHVDRLHTVGRLAAGIAHEVGTPLTVIAGRANMIAAGTLDADAVTANAVTIKEQVDRISGIVTQALRFARLDPAQRQPVETGRVIVETRDLLATLGKKRGVKIVATDLDVPLTVDADAGQMQQVLTNLIVNAAQAMPDGGTITIRTRRVSARPPGDPNAEPVAYARIDVADTGQGIAPENIDRVFDPFFTTKDVGEGTGMGLSVVYGILQEHDGWVDVESELGSGTTFSIFLPVV